MSQPKENISFATDELYASGVDVGQPTKVAPSTGLAATGFMRDTYAPAPRFNWLFSRLAEYVMGLIDICALNWSKTVNSPGAVSYVGDPLRIAVMPGVVLGQDALVMLGSNSLGTVFKMFYSRDGFEWIERAAPTFVAGTFIHGGIIAGRLPLAGGTYCIHWDRAGDYPGPNEVVKLDSLVGAWAPAGTVPPEMLLAAWIPEPLCRWFLVGMNAKIYFSDDLANAPWTQIPAPAGWAGAPPPDPTCIAAGTDGIAIGIAGGTDQVVYSQDGAAFTTVTVALGGWLVITQLAFSESRQEWLAIGDNNIVYTAPAGMAEWTQQSDITALAGAGIQSVIEFGRTWILAGTSWLYVSTDGAQTWIAVPLRGSDGASLVWKKLVPFAGRIFAGAPIAGGARTLEFSMSMAAPFAEPRP